MVNRITETPTVAEIMSIPKIHNILFIEHTIVDQLLFPEALMDSIGSSTFSVVHCGGDVEFTDGEVEHGD